MGKVERLTAMVIERHKKDDAILAKHGEDVFSKFNTLTEKMEAQLCRAKENLNLK